MIPIDPNAYQNLQALVKAAFPDLLRVNEVQAKQFSQFQTGDHYTAQILTKTGSTRYQVQVGESVLDLTVPLDFAVGEKMDLTVITNNPQLRFALTRDLSKVVQDQIPDESEKPADITQAQISNSAKVLSRLITQLEQTPQKPEGGKASPIVYTQQAIISSLPPQVSDLASKLSKAFSQSGLFYEAHQVQWITGERSLEELLAEPQGKLSSRSTQNDTNGNASLTNKNTRSDISTDTVTDNKLVTTISNALLASEIATAANVGNKSTTTEIVHPQAQPLVESQLTMLNSNELVWRGEVWQGQMMQWQIQDNPKHREGNGGEPDESQWNTSLKLELPHLGSVEFRIRLDQDKLYLHSKSENPQTDSTLVNAVPTLMDSLQQTDLHLAEYQHEIGKVGDIDAE